MPALEEPLKKVLGPATAKVMAEHLGLQTVGDLLHHYPRRYEERGRLTHLAAHLEKRLREGCLAVDTVIYQGGGQGAVLLIGVE
ncbi:hypothetical protein AB0L56_13065 [Streptomyces sp. NPDC052079]|uniref:hypothetical protein n=1 Tax=Streptomyces sp. NPDC052079 TaxID=3155526 RepID=UPI003418AD58